MCYMAVIVEPIVTQEKLLAVLAEQSEQSALDYKRVLDLGKGSARDTVELAKDVAAMQAEPEGGYIVIGADDHGVPVSDLTAELAKHFDDATLRKKLAKYLTEPDVRTAQHTVDDKLLVLIYVAPSSHGWCILHAPGEYENQGKKHTVFRVGDVFVRHGTRSERWNDTDRERIVGQVVARRKEAWRRELTEEISAQFSIGQLGASLTDMPASAVTWTLDGETFEQVVIELLRRDDDIPLRRLLTRVSQDASGLIGDDQDELRRLLDRITTFSALAIQFERHQWAMRTIDCLERLYELGFDERGNEKGTKSTVWLWLDVITRVYALGALAVRLRAWPTVRSLADRRPTGDSLYYGGWLRHALTMASRAHIFETEEKSGLLARAHNIIRTDATLHPDRPDDSEFILTSLCQFDAYGAMIVIGKQGDVDMRNFYTNFARYYSERTIPAFVTMVTDAHVRQALFDGDDQLLADAIKMISKMATQEGFNYDGWFGLNSPVVNQFIQENQSATLE